MSRISTKRSASPSRSPLARARRLATHSAPLVVLAATASMVSCSQTPSRISRGVPTKAEARALVTGASAFQETVSVRVPRAIAIEPKPGDGAAEVFAASLGHDILALEALRSLAPAVAAMQDALLLRVDDSPIADQVTADAPLDLSPRANQPTLAGRARGQRYWRHYLRIEPVDLGIKEWVSEAGGDEVDESAAAAHVVRSPGWRAIIARRELVAIDSLRAAGDTLSIAYRWHWVPSDIGKPFMTRDTLAVDRIAANGTDAPLLSPSLQRATATFVRSADGWIARGVPVATTSASPQAP